MLKGNKKTRAGSQRIQSGFNWCTSQQISSQQLLLTFEFRAQVVVAPACASATLPHCNLEQTAEKPAVNSVTLGAMVSSPSHDTAPGRVLFATVEDALEWSLLLSKWRLAGPLSANSMSVTSAVLGSGQTQICNRLFRTRGRNFYFPSFSKDRTYPAAVSAVPSMLRSMTS